MGKRKYKLSVSDHATINNTLVRMQREILDLYLLLNLTKDASKAQVPVFRVGISLSIIKSSMEDLLLHSCRDYKPELPHQVSLYYGGEPPVQGLSVFGEILENAQKASERR